MQRRQFLLATVGFVCLDFLRRPGWAQTTVDAYDFSIHTPGTNFSWDSSRFAWEYAWLAYSNRDDLIKQPPRGIPDGRWAVVDVPNLFSMDDTQALVWQHSSLNIIAFRGTEAGKLKDAIQQRQYKRELKDFLTDARYLPAPLEDDKTKQVHTGFKRAVEDAWRTWMEVATSNGKPILFIGHSLGAALSTYAAYFAEKKGRKIQAVYSFASPRVGNDIWALDYNRRLGVRTFRFANPKDLIPRLPFRGVSSTLLNSPWLPGEWIKEQLKRYLPCYRHVGQPIVLSAPPTSDWNRHLGNQPLTRKLAIDFFEAPNFDYHLNYGGPLHDATASSPGFVPSAQNEPDPANWSEIFTDIVQSSSQETLGTVPSGFQGALRTLPELLPRLRQKPSILKDAIYKHARD